MEKLTNSRTELVLAEDHNSSSSSEEEEDNVKPVFKLPPSTFSNITLQNPGSVHMGNSAVFNRDVTVIVSPGVNDLNSAGGDRLQIRDNSRVTTGDQNNLTDNENLNFSFLTAGVFGNIPRCPESQQTTRTSAEKSTLPSSFLQKKLLVYLLLAFLIIILGITVAVIWSTSSSSSDPDNIDPDPTGNHINGTAGSTPYYRRADWNATHAVETQPLHHPVVYYIISHSNTANCFNKTQCLEQVLEIQTRHMNDLAYSDIGYNFLVGGEGGVYEGRGWESVGAHAKGYNVVSIGIDMIGNFDNVVPGKRQLKGLKILMEEGVRLGKVDPAYKLIAHRQVSATESPGYAFYLVLEKWPHFYPLHVED